MEKYIRSHIISHIETAEKLLSDRSVLDPVEKAATSIIKAFSSHSKLLLAGNGGSAADSQHIAAEFVNRFYIDREGLPALALTTDTSIITAVGNDYSFDRVFSRQLASLGKEGDIFWALSTSGNSVNILEALAECRKKGIISLGFTGARGGRMEGSCDILIKVPSDETPRIQEMHILLAHVICAIVEKELFKK
ncbi:MAG TPA: D-sedoheptulose 7-phosphate isomerase [Bacteroidales bacterium]|nr:D-sedoheptulose 7-phosphate isomerase [Bacteroidales bacterium]